MIVIAIFQFKPALIDRPSTRLIVLGLAVLALASLVINAYLAHKKEKKREEVETENSRLLRDLVQRETALATELLERDKRFEDLAGLIRKQSTLPSVSLGSLRDRVLQLGRDLFDFMREKGPDPEIVLDKSKSLHDQIKYVMDTRGPYVEGIHHGYMGRFKDRTVQMFHELAEARIQIPRDLQSWEIDPPEVARAESVRKIAETLFLIAAKMDIEQASKGT